LNLRRKTAQRQRAVRFFGEAACDQKRAESGAADVDDVLEVDDKPRTAGRDQACKPFPERLCRIAVDPSLTSTIVISPACCSAISIVPLSLQPFRNFHHVVPPHPHITYLIHQCLDELDAQTADLS
jgi:hypothetical protein